MNVTLQEIEKEAEKLRSLGLDHKKALSISSSKLFCEPQKSLKLIGVTGTNGKTTVANLIAHVLNTCGRKCGCIGTMDNSGYTTPPAPILFKRLCDYKESGCEFVVMEASSHGLSQNRVYGLEFELGVFINLSRDHLDYHGSMENYASAKKKLFEQSKKAVINVDDPFANDFLSVAPYSIGCAIKRPAEYKAENLCLTENKVEYELMGQRVVFPVIGRFSVYNSILAIASCNQLGVSLNDCIQAVGSFSGVEGRVQKLSLGSGFEVFIDYAHTPHGMENLLSTLKPLCKGRLITVFGCGGERDRGKRPLMLRAAAKYSDYIIVTSDNPRNEPPYKIIKEILSGVHSINTPFAVIENRKKAIEFAVANCLENDILVLAGKGHEQYQITALGKEPFNEKEILENAVRRLAAEGEVYERINSVTGKSFL